jgi:hypothetical protein
LAATVLVAVLVAPRPVLAASGSSLALDDVIQLADEIVVARVDSSEARWRGRLIVTVTRLTVGETLKGQPPATFEITQVGGTAVLRRLAKRVTMTVSSFTALDPGEQVVLFVDGHVHGVRQLVGGPSGKLVVQAEPTGGSALAVGPRRLAVRGGAGGTVLAGEAMSLDGLRERIRARLKEKAP